MKSPKDMRIIQIDITNACVYSCSNCTRFCGHHKKPFFMNFDTFRKAVDSLEGYVGTFGIMGGEPTLHPEFERFADYISSKFNICDAKKKNNLVLPQRDFMKAIMDKEGDHTVVYDSGRGNRQTVIGPGLWSSAGSGYNKHYEVIQDVFLYQAFNDHFSEMYHQPILLTRKELGIDDEKWIRLRDCCWIQNEWSASITPKGAFFCEIAASLDILFDGPGGWPIEPGWWRREVKDFNDQWHWCELCGIACDTFTRNANEQVDDISPVMYEKLKRLGSPKLESGNFRIIKVEDGVISDDSKASDKRFSKSMPYIEKYEDRFTASKSELFPKGFISIIICDEPASLNKGKLHYQQFVKTYILCRTRDASQKLSELFHDISEVNVMLIEQKLGVTLNRIIWDAREYYIVVHSDKVIISKSFCALLAKCVINPGTMHYIDFSNPCSRDTEFVLNADFLTEGFAALFHKNAISLRKIGFDGIANSDDIRVLIKKWDPMKVVELSSEMVFVAPETVVKPGVKYAIYGTGRVGNEAIRQICACSAEFFCAVDSSPEKWGHEFHGKTIQKPEYLRDNIDLFDRVIIATKYYYYEIKQSLLDLGIPSDRFNLLS